MIEPAMPIGVVLAGGASRRFGSDKGSLTIDGRSLTERALAVLSRACDEVAVASRGRQMPGARLVADGPGSGPAAGILGAANAFPGRSLLVLACDLPAVSEPLLARLLDDRNLDWLLPRHSGRVEPLCARYGPAALAALEEQVATGDFALHHLQAADLRIGYLENEALGRFGTPRELFLNINTPEDLQSLAKVDLA
jgi:molybdopterin-guanine dinucleotide biosynthesis protein A